MAYSNLNVLEIVGDVRLNTTKLNDQIRDMQSSVYNLTSKAAGVSATDMVKKVSLYEREMMQAVTNIQYLKTRLDVLARKQTKTLNEKEEMQRKTNDLLKQRRDLLYYEKRYKREEVLSNKLIKKREEALNKSLERSARTFSEKIVDGVEGSTETLTQVLSDLKNFNPSSILKKLGASLEEKGHAMNANAKRYEAVAGLDKRGGLFSSKTMASVMGQAGNFLTKLGPAVLAIGAVAAGLVAIVGVLIEADVKTKELNRTLMQTGSISGDVVNDLGSISENIDKVRHSFVGFGSKIVGGSDSLSGAMLDSFKFNQSWRTTAKDHLEILAQYSESGTTLKELMNLTKKNVSEMDKYREATTGALAFSKLLGLSTSEITTSFTKYMDQLGVNLQTIEEKFSGINMAARESGFGVKNFFSKVLEATSGLSMYNVRLEESAGLLVDLGKILGKEGAGDYLQQLNKAQKSEDTIERTRRVMIMGEGRSLEISKKDAANQIQDFQNFFNTLEGSQKSIIGESFAGKGINLLDSPEKIGEALSKLNNEQMGDLIANLERSGVSNIGNRVTSLYGTSMAYRGGLGGAQASREFQGPGAVLLNQLDQMDQILKKHPELTEIEKRAAWEHISGKTGEEAQQLYRLGLTYEGRHGVLNERQSEIKRMIEEGDDPSSIVAGNKEKDIEAYGVYVNEKGQRVRATKMANGEYAESLMGDSFDDLILSLGQELAGQQAEQLPKDLLAAQEIAQNTGNLVDIERSTEQILEGIYEVTQQIYAWITNTTGQKAEAVQKAGLLETGSREGARKLKEDVRKLKTGLNTLDESQIIAEYGSRENMEALIRNKEGKALELEGMAKFYGDVKKRTVNALGIEGLSPDEILQQSITKASEANPEMRGLINSYAIGGYETMRAKAMNPTLMPNNNTAYAPYGPGNMPMVNLTDMQVKSDLKFDKLQSTNEYKNAKTLIDLTKDLPKEIIKAQDENELMNFLGAAAVDPSLHSEYLNNLLSGQVPEELRGAFESYDFRQGGRGDAIKRALSMPKANDLLVQFGPNGPKWAHRVDNNDVGVIAKPGGGLSKGGGGGGVTIINNHMYNDARGNFKSIRDYQKVMSRVKR